MMSSVILRQVWFINIASEYCLSWTCAGLNYSDRSKWLLGRPFENRFPNADLHKHDSFFNFCQLTTKYLFWMQPPTNTHTLSHTHTYTHRHTMRAMAGRHSALHPVVSLHASKLFSVTQILIWKSQLTELTETREKGSKDPLSFSFSLFASFNS